MAREAHEPLQDQLDAEEQKILTYIQAERPEVEGLFLHHLDHARRGILHRFLQAVVRENIGGAGDQTRYDAESRTLRVVLPAERVLTARVALALSMGRFDLDDEPVLVHTISDPTHCTELVHPVQLLDLLKSSLLAEDGDVAAEQRYERFRQELQNSVANYALALAGAALRTQELQAEAAPLASATTLDWVAQQLERDESFSPLSFYEQWVVEGHPLHPGAKIKMGLDVGDVIRYSPEWGAQPPVVPVAVRKEAREYASLQGQTPSELLYAEYPGLQAHVAHALQERGLDPEDYDLIPVHPWQHDHTLPEMHRAAIEAQEIVPVPSYRIRTAALMSFRSLAPHQERLAGRHHIKTAVNVQTTGAIRTVQPSAAVNGPLISGLLRDIQTREADFGGQFRILEERVGVHYSPTDASLSSQERFQLEKNLASILRENPENHVEAGEVPMPGSALLARSPLSGQPIVGELIEQYAQVNQIDDRGEAAVAFMAQYADTCLPGFLITMCRYGIALEGHLQNSVPVFRDGRLVRMILRDFGGVRILRERIARQGLTAEFHRGAATIIDDVQDLRNKIYYPVFQNHFGELIAAIVRWSGVEEARLWQPVATACRRVFAELQQDGAIARQTAEDEAVLFAATIDLKSMATMRLLGDVTTYTFAKVPNPLN